MKSVSMSCLIAAALTVFAGHSFATVELSPAREIEVVTVKGASLPELLGKLPDNFSVMAVSGGRLVPIPFQFDDMDMRGLPYVPGGVLEISGTENIIEAHDELAFMLKDAGEQAGAEQKAGVAGKIISELEFPSQKGAIYAYVVEGNSERSPVRYVSFNQETGLIKTDSYSLQIQPNNALVWSDFFYNGYKSETSILDTMKLRVRAKLGFIGATISNKFIPNSIKAVKDGPVRNVLSVDASLGILGINFAKAGAAVTINRDSIEFPVFLVIPKAASVLSDLNIEISLDFNEMEGARIRTALGPTDPIIAGADKFDPSHGVSLENNWLSGSSGKNWDIIAVYNGSDNFKPTMNLLYKDKGLGSKPDAPERYEGSSPQVGYIISDVPTGVDIVLGINLYFNKDFWARGGVEKATKELRQPLVANVVSVSDVSVGEL